MKYINENMSPAHEKWAKSELRIWKSEGSKYDQGEYVFQMLQNYQMTEFGEKLVDQFRSN